MRSLPAVLPIVTVCFAVAALNRARGEEGEKTPARVEAKASATAVDPKAVDPIVDSMRRIQKQLGHSDTGEQTRVLQKKVVDDLQKLIDAASQQSSSQSDSDWRDQGERKDAPRDGASPRSNQPQRSGSSLAGKRSQPGMKTGEGRPIPTKNNSAPPGTRALLHEIWGHLPPAVRERVPSEFGEAVLPSYDELVRHYYEALLEGTSASSRTASPAPLAPTPAPGR